MLHSDVKEISPKLEELQRLRDKCNTVRCIVQSLISETSTELTEELQKTQGLQLDHSFQSPDDYECLDDWENWMPDPVDAPSKTNSRRTSDIISMLVNIYGSKELFVNEYRSLLSNRLLANCSYDTEKEIRSLELLKLRFGEIPLHQCEVMLKDIGDSKRINSLLHTVDGGCPELQTQAFPVNALVLSAQFWPQFKNETLELPPEIGEALEVYTKAFQTLKGNRTLVWKPHLGFANIALEIGDKKVNITVTPVQAAIITTTCGQYQGSCFYLEEKNYILAISRNYRGKFSRRVLSCGRWWR